MDATRGNPFVGCIVASETKAATNITPNANMSKEKSNNDIIQSNLSAPASNEESADKAMILPIAQKKARAHSVSFQQVTQKHFDDIIKRSWSTRNTNTGVVFGGENKEGHGLSLLPSGRMWCTLCNAPINKLNRILQHLATDTHQELYRNIRSREEVNLENICTNKMGGDYPGATTAKEVQKKRKTVPPSQMSDNLETSGWEEVDCVIGQETCTLKKIKSAKKRKSHPPKEKNRDQALKNQRKQKTKTIKTRISRASSLHAREFPLLLMLHVFEQNACIEDKEIPKIKDDGFIVFHPFHTLFTNKTPFYDIQKLLLKHIKGLFKSTINAGASQSVKKSSGIGIIQYLTRKESIFKSAPQAQGGRNTPILTPICGGAGWKSMLEKVGSVYEKKTASGTIETFVNMDVVLVVQGKKQDKIKKTTSALMNQGSLEYNPGTPEGADLLKTLSDHATDATSINSHAASVPDADGGAAAQKEASNIADASDACMVPVHTQRPVADDARPWSHNEASKSDELSTIANNISPTTAANVESPNGAHAPSAQEPSSASIVHEMIVQNSDSQKTETTASKPSLDKEEEEVTVQIIRDDNDEVQGVSFVPGEFNLQQMLNHFAEEDASIFVHDDDNAKPSLTLLGCSRLKDKGGVNTLHIKSHGFAKFKLNSLIKKVGLSIDEIIIFKLRYSTMANI